MNNLTESEENELKLIAKEKTQAKMLASIRDKSEGDIEEILGIVKSAFDMAEFDISQERVETIIDEYFDTNDLALYGFHASVRVRRTLGKTFITVKKLKSMEQGQFSRDEIEKEISEESYADFVERGFPSIVIENLPDIKDKKLSLILRVDNQRRAFCLKRSDELYELDLDLFRYTNPRTKRTGKVQCEVEIEARNQPAKNKLGNIRRNLVHIVKAFDYSKDSKYERGVKHFGFDKPPLQQWLLENLKSAEGLAWIAIFLTVLGIIITILLSH